MHFGNLSEKSVKIGKDNGNYKMLCMLYGIRWLHSASGRHDDDC